jgi:hypothetical protein
VISSRSHSSPTSEVAMVVVLAAPVPPIDSVVLVWLVSPLEILIRKFGDFRSPEH